MLGKMFLWTLVVLIVFVNGDTFGDCLDKWLKANIYDNSNHLTAKIPENSVLFPPSVYLKYLPKCITTVTSETLGSCDMNFNSNGNNNRNLTPLKGLFACINAEAAGGELQNKGATAVLWSGVDGKKKAEDLFTAHKKITHLFNWDPVLGVYPDTKVSVLKKYLGPAGFSGKAADIYAGIKNMPKGYERMLIDMSCMWLVFNSDPTSHSNTMHDWASLAGYETYANKANKGRKSISYAGITKALVINNYFWNVEVPTIARLFSLIDYTNIQGQTRNNAHLTVHLRTYTVNAQSDKITASGWAAHDLFGALNTLNQIPIVFEGPDHLQYPIYKGDTADNTATIAKLGDLVTKYNAGKGSNAQITSPLHLDTTKLLDFIEWTRGIPFKSFDANSHMLGGWVTSTVPHPNPDQIPGGDFAHYAPYNRLEHKHRANKQYDNLMNNEYVINQRVEKTGRASSHAIYSADYDNDSNDSNNGWMMYIVGLISGLTLISGCLCLGCLCLAVGAILGWVGARYMIPAQDKNKYAPVDIV